MTEPARDQPAHRGQRTLLLGCESPFTRAVLEVLLDRGVAVAGVLLDLGGAPAGGAPLDSRTFASAEPMSVLTLAQESGIEAYRFEDVRSAAARARVSAIAPEVALVACLSRILGPEWRALPPSGCLNLHPSWLPAWRGPAPVFWQLRDGAGEAGVTLHRVEATVDGGAVVARASMPIPDRIAASALEVELARRGAALAADALLAGRIEGRPQDPAGATRAPRPGPADFRLDPGWTAARAFRFMRGTAEWGIPFEVVTAAGVLRIARALDLEPGATMPEPFVEAGEGVVRIGFDGGVVRAVLQAGDRRPEAGGKR